MEAGTLLAKDVLPLVGAEFAKAARLGGALSKALLTVRVQQGRFFTQLQKAQNTIFKEGFGKSYAKLLDKLTKSLVKLEPLLKALGQVFEVLISTFAELASFLLAPLEVLSLLLDSLGLLKQAGGELAGGTVPKLIAAFTLMLLPLGKVLGIFLAIKAAAEEVIGLSTKGVMGEMERRIGKDIGFLDFSKGSETGDGKSEAESKFQSLLGANANTRGAFSNDPYRDLIDKFLGSNTRDDGIVLSAVGALFGSSEVVVNNTFSIDEFGNGSANTAVTMQAANAQAN